MRTIGLDTSSKSVAWSVLDDGKLIRYGEFYIEGKNNSEKLADCKNKMEALYKSGEFQADYIYCEEAVKVISITTLTVMAKYLGVVQSVLGQVGCPVICIVPVAWQTYIGNPNLKREEKTELLLKHREIKTQAHKAKFFREYRKNRTKEWCKKMFDVVVDNDNQSDSIGLAWFAYDTNREHED